jgi:hypothetical protein
MAAPAFDPLVDLAGVWNTKLAEKYLPLPDLLSARYECVYGRLIVTPTEVASNSYGEHKLSALLQPGAEAAGLYVMGPVNLTFHPDFWLQPDLTVLHTPPRDAHDDTWVPAQLCTMAVEFVSRGSARSDKVDKPKLYAEGGIPYLMRVELVPGIRHASAVLLKLSGGEYQTIAQALAGQRFETAEPFAIRFDPRTLLF